MLCWVEHEKFYNLGAWCFIGPDLGLNCLHKLSAYDFRSLHKQG